MLNDLGRKVIGQARHKGWNLYMFEDGDSIDKIVPRGPAESLEMNRQYMLLPRISDATNRDKVVKVSGYLIREKGIIPALQYKGSLFPLPSLGFYEEGVFVKGVCDYTFTYEEFDEAIETLSPTTSMN